jgi:hypothetical protein
MSQDGERGAAWLLLVHQLPPRPTNARVKTWRRLQALGAVALRNAVYVLPHTDGCREDFEWMKSEIEGMRGEATVFAADNIDTFSNDEIVAAFRRAREADYADLNREADALLAAHGKRSGRGPAARRVARRAHQLREKLREIDAIAFYPPENRDAAAAAVARAERLTDRGGETPRSSGDRLDAARFQKRVWVTRPRPGIDRMSSAWLIRRFIDPKARFAFSDTPPSAGAGIPFDMYGVEFSHTDRGCTFETIVARFGLASPAIDRIAHIVHDLDLKDARYEPPEAPAFAALVDGLRQMHADDGELLEHGMAMFEAVYRALTSGAAPTGSNKRTARRKRSRR